VLSAGVRRREEEGNASEGLVEGNAKKARDMGFKRAEG
jgi:hypothetical protein